MPKRIDFLNHPKVNIFGAFYPVGYAVLAFHDATDAERVKQLWVDGGHAAGDATIIHSRDLVHAEGGGDAVVDGIATAVDGETKLMHKHRELANGGATFLMIFVPDDALTDALSAILKNFQPLTADKYERFTIRGL
jgi:hypothetical protein